jgi:hypothetical protein
MWKLLKAMPVAAVKLTCLLFHLLLEWHRQTMRKQLVSMQEPDVDKNHLLYSQLVGHLELHSQQHWQATALPC